MLVQESGIITLVCTLHITGVIIHNIVIQGGGRRGGAGEYYTSSSRQSRLCLGCAWRVNSVLAVERQVALGDLHARV